MYSKIDSKTEQILGESAKVEDVKVEYSYVFLQLISYSDWLGFFRILNKSMRYIICYS